MGNPLPLNLAQECRKAQKILTEFVDPSHGGLDRIIPLSVLKRAQGFAIFSVARLGFLVSARAGSGVVIARLDDGSWSSPSALGLGGLGGGFNAGLDVTDFLIVLNSKQAVRSFMATGSLQLGGNLSVAVGPLGRAAEASGTLNSSGNVAAMYSYSRSKGLYGGVSVEGTILVDRADANSKAYGRHVTAKQLLSGSVEPPVFAEPLITTIEKFTLTGRVGERIDAGRRDNDMDGWSIDEDYRSNADMDSLDREMQQARLSPSSPNRRARGVEDYETQRPGDYAFGSKGGGSHTNSPTRLRKSFLGGTTSSPFTGTDYAQDGGSSNGNYESPYTSGNKSRMPFRRNKSSGSGSLFGDEAAVRYSNASKTSAFPTSFERSDEEDEPARKITRTPSPSRDNPSLRDSWEEAEELRRKPHSSFARSNGNDLLDFELDRSAVTQRQAPRAREKDLIDFNDPTPSRFPANSAPRRGGSGLDDLDKELQARSSMSSNDSLPHGTAWNVDYAYNNGDTAPTRPKMHTRTSSKQKIMNRLRGNSQSSKNAFANIETWDQRFNSRQQDRTPSPNLMGSGTPKNGTPTGFRSSGTPTGRRSGGTPTGLRSSTTPTGHKRSTPTPSKSSVPAVGGYESTQVIANFDFEGQEIDDLSFKRGDVIRVLRRTANRDDWWLGQLGAKTGNFPANYTEDV